MIMRGNLRSHRCLLWASLAAFSIAAPLPVAAQPAPSRSIASSSAAPSTLVALKARIDEIVRQPALEPGFFAVKIVSLDTGQTVFEQNANKFVRPASNMKLYTVATAFDRLTPDYHFVTSVYAREKVIVSGQSIESGGDRVELRSEEHTS